jgi:tetratricopeptide (TPR) repeat protein
MLHYAGGEHDAAFADADHATRMNPSLSQGFAARANEYSHRNDLQHALSDFQRAAELAPTSAPLPFAAGSILLRRESWSEAKSAMSEAIRRKADYAAAYVGRAYAESKLGDAAAAQADLEKARSLDPDIIAKVQTRGLDAAGGVGS